MAKTTTFVLLAALTCLSASNADDLSQFEADLASEDSAVRREAIMKFSFRGNWDGKNPTPKQVRRALVAHYAKETRKNLKAAVVQTAGMITQYERPAWKDREVFFLAAAKSPLPGVRVNAAEAITRFDKVSANAIGNMKSLLASDPATRVRIQALSALVAHQKSNPELKTLLRNVVFDTKQPIEVRTSMVRLIGNTYANGESDPAALALLGKVSSLPELELREAVISEFNAAYRRNPDALPFVLAALKDKEGAVRARAAGLLFPMWYMDRRPNGKRFMTEEISARVGKALMPLLKDRVAQVRAEAFDSLAKIAPKTDGFLPALIAAIDDPAFAVQSTAVFRLGRLKAKEALPRLVKMRLAMGNVKYKKIPPRLLRSVERAILEIGGKEKLAAVQKQAEK